MSKLIDLTGQRFGKLTVLRRDNDAIGRGTCWMCQCDCGNVKSIRSATLVNGDSKSCGCSAHEHACFKDLTGKRFGSLVVLRRDNSMDSKIDHGLHWICQCDCGNTVSVRTTHLTRRETKSCGCGRIKHRQYHHRLYHIWTGMMRRCYKESDRAYKDYGGRGIEVCDRWHDVINFISDMQPSFKEGLSIDRIDDNGNYSPDNCRWADRVQQARNTRRNVYVTYKGKRMLQKDFAGYIGIGCKTVTRYLRNHRLDGTILVEGGVNDNIKEMQGREPLWLTS